MSLVALEHARNEQFDHLNDSLDVGVEDRVQVLQVRVDDGTREGPSRGVVDQNINIVSELNRQALIEGIAGSSIRDIKLGNGDSDRVLGLQLSLEIGEGIDSSCDQNLDSKSLFSFLNNQIPNETMYSMMIRTRLDPEAAKWRAVAFPIPAEAPVLFCSSKEMCQPNNINTQNNSA